MKLFNIFKTTNIKKLAKVIRERYYGFLHATSKWKTLKELACLLRVVTFWPTFDIQIDMTLTVCFYHVMYIVWSQSTLYSCVNVKEVLAQNRRNIWCLSDCNGTQTQNYVLCKQTLKVFVHKLSWCGFESCESHL